MAKRHKRGTRAGKSRDEAASTRRVNKARVEEEDAQRPPDERMLRVAEDRVPKLLDYLDRQGHPIVTIRTVRAYVRDCVVPELVKRMYRVAMGIELFEVPTQFGGTVIVPATATVQMNTARALVELGVPRPQRAEGEGMPFAGIIVIGSEGPELQEARDRARAHRLEDHGNGVHQISQQAYLPPPGHRVAIIEDDLSNPGTHTNGRDPDAAPLPITPRPMTKAQEIAARRRAEKLRKTG